MAMSGDLDVIRGLEERLHDPVVRGSPDRVAALLSDDFLEFGKSGQVFGKEDTVRSLAVEGGELPSDVTAYGYELRTLAKDVVLLTYRSVKKREGFAELHALRSSIWKLIDGRWQLVFHQGTPTPPSISIF